MININDTIIPKDKVIGLFDLDMKYGTLIELHYHIDDERIGAIGIEMYQDPKDKEAAYKRAENYLKEKGYTK